MVGLKKDMVVVEKNGSLVGRIIGQVSFKEARIQLITDNGIGISVFSQENKVLGVASGDGNGCCFFKYVLATNEEVHEGDEVITSGFDGIFPPGLRVGEIVSITTNTSLFKRIIIKPYFNFKHLNEIAVIMIDPKRFF